MKLKDILATASIVLSLVAVVVLMVWHAAHPVPPEQRAFRSDWDCETYGEGGEVCRQRTP